MPVSCGIIVYESHVVLLKTPGQSTGVVNIRAQSMSGNTQQGALTFSTNCQYLNVPSGQYNVPAGGGGSVEFTFGYNLATHGDCGVSRCGTITINYDNGDGCTGTETIDVWIWNACGQNDVRNQCGFLVPNGLYVNLQDEDTWELKLPILADFGYNHPDPVGAGRNYLADFTIISESCGLFPSGSNNKQFVFDKTGHVFEYDLDLSDIDPNSIQCGQNLACEIRVTVDSSLDPVMAACAGAAEYNELVIPVYVTNECPQRSCPISWTTASQVINKNAGDTGTLVPFIQNNGTSPVTISFSSSCPHVQAPQDVIIPDGQQQFIALPYDVSGFNTCGTTQCGVITASVTYNGGDEACERTLPISIVYECPGPESDNYETRLRDSDGESSVEVSDDCSSIAIVDMSVFGSMGHAVANFTGYRKITVRHLQSGQQHVMSSVQDGNEDIPTASDGVFAFNYTITPGGVFEVELCQVPTWNAASSFQADDDIVFDSGKLYAAISDSQGVHPSNSPLSALNWVEIQPDEVGDYSDKYCDTQVVVSSCDIDQCFTSRYVRLACELDCNALDLCKNKEWLEVNKLFYLMTALAEAQRQNNMTAATTIYDKAKSICNC